MSEPVTPWVGDAGSGDSDPDDRGLRAPESLLLSVEEMGRADRLAIARGIAGSALMEAAGRAVELAIRARWSPCPVVVLCGPGNNGGDGFVVARRLRQAGWPVRLALLGERAALTGDAALHAGLWDEAAGAGAVEAMEPERLEGAALIVDALFGAGLSRPLGGAAAAVVEAANRGSAPLVAVDVPSGLCGDSGEPLGGLAARAALTVTFFRAKPGHLLYPGRRLCGALRVADIGIPEDVLPALGARTWRNEPPLWRHRVPARRPESHKYDYGHVLVAGGRMTGAARLAALAALRAGAGLVSVAAPPDDRLVYALTSPSLIVRDCPDLAAWRALLEDNRLNVLVVGPGLGRDEAAWRLVLASLAAGRGTLLDADALTLAEGRSEVLFGAVRGPTVLTPHDGEFGRLFPDIVGDRLARARRAAERAGCVVLLKGPDSVIAAPDGRAAVTANAPASLATAGSGDVLSGIVGGLLAQGLPAFEAAALGAWLQGEAARLAGPGLLSEDLPARLGQALQDASNS